MRVMQGIRIKRLHKKRECINTLVFKCNCCDEEPMVELEFSNLKMDKTKNAKNCLTIVRLCEEHIKVLKEYINYF